MEDDRMEITIVGRKCTPKDTFKERAESKLAKVDKFFPGETHAKITATAVKDMITVEITLAKDGIIFRAESTKADINEALDDCVNILIRKIRKNKTKLEKKLRDMTIDDIVAGEEKVADETEYDLIRTKEVSVKAQTVDEAILQMNMLGHQFYMFLDPDLGIVNVVYRRKDGGYGLLQPDY